MRRYFDKDSLVILTVASFLAWGCTSSDEQSLPLQEESEGYSLDGGFVDLFELDAGAPDPVLPDIPPRDVFFHCPDDIQEPFDFIFVRSADRSELNSILNDVKAYATSLLDQNLVTPCDPQDLPVVQGQCDDTQIECETASYSTPAGLTVSYTSWSANCYFDEYDNALNGEGLFEIHIESTADTWQSIEYRRTHEFQDYPDTGGFSSSGGTFAGWQGDLGLGLPPDEELSNHSSANSPDACGSGGSSWGWTNSTCSGKNVDNCMVDSFGDCYEVAYRLLDPSETYRIRMDLDCMCEPEDDACCMVGMGGNTFTKDYWQSCTP